MKKCKECGREEWGYLSTLNEDGYCPYCAKIHNAEKVKELKKQIEYLQEQLKEANEVIKHYANDENWCDYYDDDDEKMTKAIYIDCDGTLEASCYLEKWGVK